MCQFSNGFYGLYSKPHNKPSYDLELLANLCQLLPNNFKHEAGPAFSSCLVVLQDYLFSSDPWTMRWLNHSLGKQDVLKVATTMCHKPSKHKKLAQHLQPDPLRSGDHVRTTWPSSLVLTHPQGFAVLSNACTELFPSHLGRRYFLSPPHFKCVILTVVVYKQAQVRSFTRCCKDKGLYVGSLLSKPAGTTNISFGFSMLTSPGLSNSSLERPCQFDVKRWPAQNRFGSLENWKTWLFPPQDHVLVLVHGFIEAIATGRVLLNSFFFLCVMFFFHCYFFKHKTTHRFCPKYCQ